MKKIRIVLIVLPIVGLLAYLLYFREYFAYKKVQEDRSEIAWTKYMRDYPYGRYIEDVYFIKTESEDNIKSIKEFQSKFPESKYQSEINDMKNDLWQLEIDRYNQKVKSNKNTEAVTFFRDLLYYMRDNNLYDIDLEFNSSIDIQDFKYYSEDIRMIMELFYSDEELEFKDSNIISLESNFNKGSEGYLEGIISEGLEKSIDSLFSPGYINISKYSDSKIKANINYKIKNSEDEGFPVIWTYYTVSMETGRKTITAYLLGIDIDFQFDLAIPNSDKHYSFEEKAVPSGTISNVDDINNGYAQMTAMSFRIFADKIANNLGIKNNEEE